MSDRHRPLSCTLRGCEFDMRHDRRLLDYTAGYLRRFHHDILTNKIRHFSMSVHPADGARLTDFIPDTKPSLYDLRVTWWCADDAVWFDRPATFDDLGVARDD